MPWEKCRIKCFGFWDVKRDTTTYLRNLIFLNVRLFLFTGLALICTSLFTISSGISNSDVELKEKEKDIPHLILSRFYHQRP